MERQARGKGRASSATNEHGQLDEADLGLRVDDNIASFTDRRFGE
jgi:hypothetical protein